MKLWSFFGVHVDEFAGAKRDPAVLRFWFHQSFKEPKVSQRKSWLHVLSPPTTYIHTSFRLHTQRGHRTQKEES